MIPFSKLKKLSFLVYGLGASGQSVVSHFKKKKIKNYQVWDDKNKSISKKKRAKNLSGYIK
jgi:UDP-N-acetylmuramoylalanine-D-glutamate ligase